MAIDLTTLASLTCPSLPTSAWTSTVPSTLADRARSGYSGGTLVMASGSSSTYTYSPSLGSSSSDGGATTSSPSPVETPGVVWAISSWEAIVCSGGASASGTGTATPTVGGVTGTATCTWGGGSLWMSGGGAASSRYGTTSTLVSCGRLRRNALVPNESRNTSRNAPLPIRTPRNMYFRATSFSSGAP